MSFGGVLSTVCQMLCGNRSMGLLRQYHSWPQMGCKTDSLYHTELCYYIRARSPTANQNQMFKHVTKVMLTHG